MKNQVVLDLSMIRSANPRNFRDITETVDSWGIDVGVRGKRSSPPLALINCTHPRSARLGLVTLMSTREGGVGIFPREDDDVKLYSAESVLLEKGDHKSLLGHEYGSGFLDNVPLVGLYTRFGQKWVVGANRKKYSVLFLELPKGYCFESATPEVLVRRLGEIPFTRKELPALYHLTEKPKAQSP